MAAKIPADMAEALKMIEQLQSEIDTLNNENTDLKDRVTTLKKENDNLENLVHNLNEMLTKSRKMMFGRSSEQLKNIYGSEQLSFFNEAETEYNSGAPEPKEETLVKSHTRKAKRTQAEITENLEHREEIIDLPEDKKSCDICGEPLVCIGKEKLRSELNIVPAQVFVIDYYRYVYKCPECEKETDEANIYKPEAPVPVMKKSMASPATVAYTIQEKYQNGVTLFRQEQYWKSAGVELNRNTLANWIIRSSLWLKPLWQLMKDELFKEDIVHADETELRVLKRDGIPTNSMSRMWVFCSGAYSKKKMALYKYHATRSSAVVRDVIGDYAGYLQTDGYSAYNAAVKAKRIGCWAHAKRKFVDCLPKGIEDKNSKAAQALEIIERLFAIEKSLEGMPKETISAEREKKSVPLLKAYWNLLENTNAAGGSNLYKAVNYSLNHRAELEGYLAEGRIEMTNNRAERAIKPFVMARKNFLFSDTSRGAESSAMCFTMIESAKLNGLNVYGYLIYLFSELPKLGEEPKKEDLTKMLPWSQELPAYCKRA